MSTQNAFDAAQKYCPYLSSDKELMSCLNDECMAWRDDDCVFIVSNPVPKNTHQTKPE